MLTLDYIYRQHLRIPQIHQNELPHFSLLSKLYEPFDRTRPWRSSEVKVKLFQLWLWDLDFGWALPVNTSGVALKQHNNKLCISACKARRAYSRLLPLLAYITSSTAARAQSWSSPLGDCIASFDLCVVMPQKTSAGEEADKAAFATPQQLQAAKFAIIL